MKIIYTFTNDLHSKHSLDEPLAGEVGVESKEEDTRAQRSGLKVDVVLSQKIRYGWTLLRVANGIGGRIYRLDKNCDLYTLFLTKLKTSK